MDAFDEERFRRVLAENTAIVRGLRELLYARRDLRRSQQELADGEKATVLRGRCVELTSLLNDLFSDKERA